jgi:Glutamate-cysteine ligase family 2(GCS2)
MSVQAEAVIGDTIPGVNFGSADDFSLGVEEELLLVDPRTNRLEHGAVELLERLEVAPGEGAAAPEAYAALIELASPICADASEATRACATLRGRLRSAGATVIGAGLHPTAEFGDTAQFPSRRYRCWRRRCAGCSAGRRRARCTCTSGCPTPRPRSASTTRYAATCRCCRRCRRTRRTGTGATPAWPAPGPRCSAPSRGRRSRPRSRRLTSTQSWSAR